MAISLWLDELQALEREWREEMIFASCRLLRVIRRFAYFTLKKSGLCYNHADRLEAAIQTENTYFIME